VVGVEKWPVYHVDLNENKTDLQNVLAAKVVDNVTDVGGVPVNVADDMMDGKAVTVTFDDLKE
jgi:hypothetical protein